MNVRRIHMQGFASYREACYVELPERGAVIHIYDDVALMYQLVMPRGHYKRPSAEQRFLKYVDKGDGSGCWTWCGGRCGSLPYGAFWFSGRGMRAHRFSYELFIGPVPEGLLVLHRCDNPSCVRPDHLFVGTQSANMLDKFAKGRHDIRGERSSSAKLTDEKVRALRADAATGVSQRLLSKKYGVSQQQVSEVVRRVCWAHVE